MNKVAHYLQQHLTGEILTSPDVLQHFSSDGSILSVLPMLVAHPRNEQDFRKAARFSWQLAERGKIIPLTVRGKGRDQTGAAIGQGVILSTPAHINKIIQFDPRSGQVTVQPGITAAKLQQTLMTHGRYIPSFPVDDELVTIGGLLGNNDPVGEAYAFGPAGEFVESLRVVLANGEVVEVKRISKRELNKKLGLASFEGEIYRSIDALIEENQDKLKVLNSSDLSKPGYSIADVKLKDGSFDLTPLFLGSQGTLGFITEVTLRTEEYNPDKDLAVAFFADYQSMSKAVQEINALKQTPLEMEFIDQSVVQYVRSINPSLLKSTFGRDLPEVTLFVSYSEHGNMSKRNIKKMLKILEQHSENLLEVDDSNQEAWVVASHLTGVFLAHSDNSGLKALPVLPGASLPLEKMPNFINQAKKLGQTGTGRQVAIYGQAGNGIVVTVPLLNIQQLGDRQKVFKLLELYYQLVAQSGGSIGFSVQEGRLLASQVDKFLDKTQLEMMANIKKIFDPYKILNPEVKQPLPIEKIKTQLRKDFQNSEHYNLFPRGK